MRCRLLFSSIESFPSRMLGKFCLYLSALGLVTLGMAAQQSQLPQIPTAVQDGSAHLVGTFNPQQMLRVTFALRSPHMQDEEEFVRQLQDPLSPQFHRYLSDEEWNARFSPSVEDEQAVVAWAKSQGLTITQRFPNRLLVNVEAPVAVLQRAFNISINAYQLNGQSYFSNDRDPVIPVSLGNVVQYVFGLNNVDVMRRASGNLPKRSYPSLFAGTCVCAFWKSAA